MKLTGIVVLLMMSGVLSATVVRADKRQPPCPHVCNGTYALCISATCNKDALCGLEGVGSNVTSGGGGYCFIFTGLSCSYYSPCNTNKSQVTSTYSRHLMETYGFVNQHCDWLPNHADCMGCNCTATGNTAPLHNVLTNQTDRIATAKCQCKNHSPHHRNRNVTGGAFQVKTKDALNCLYDWSTY